MVTEKGLNSIADWIGAGGKVLDQVEDVTRLNTSGTTASHRNNRYRAEHEYYTKAWEHGSRHIDEHANGRSGRRGGGNIAYGGTNSGGDYYENDPRYVRIEADGKLKKEELRALVSSANLDPHILISFIRDLEASTGEDILKDGGKKIDYGNFADAIEKMAEEEWPGDAWVKNSEGLPEKVSRARDVISQFEWNTDSAATSIEYLATIAEKHARGWTETIPSQSESPPAPQPEEVAPIPSRTADRSTEMILENFSKEQLEALAKLDNSIPGVVDYDNPQHMELVRASIENIIREKGITAQVTHANGQTATLTEEQLINALDKSNVAQYVAGQIENIAKTGQISKSPAPSTSTTATASVNGTIEGTEVVAMFGGNRSTLAEKQELVAALNELYPQLVPKDNPNTEQIAQATQQLFTDISAASDTSPAEAIQAFETLNENMPAQFVINTAKAVASHQRQNNSGANTPAQPAQNAFYEIDENSPPPAAQPAINNSPEEDVIVSINEASGIINNASKEELATIKQALGGKEIGILNVMNLGEELNADTLDNVMKQLQQNNIVTASETANNNGLPKPNGAILEM